jgi:hypothetical protein
MALTGDLQMGSGDVVGEHVSVTRSVRDRIFDILTG